MQGEVQKELDRRSNTLVVAACRRTQIFAIASEAWRSCTGEYYLATTDQKSGF